MYHDLFPLGSFIHSYRFLLPFFFHLFIRNMLSWILHFFGDLHTGRFPENARHMYSYVSRESGKCRLMIQSFSSGSGSGVLLLRGHAGGVSLGVGVRSPWWSFLHDGTWGFLKVGGAQDVVKRADCFEVAVEWARCFVSGHSCVDRVQQLGAGCIPFTPLSQSLEGHGEVLVGWLVLI